MRVAVVLVILLGVVQSWGRGGVDFGNGGHGVKPEAGQNRVYLLDFFDRGIHENPYFNGKIPSNADTVRELERSFDQLEGVPYQLIAKKLSEVERYDPVLSILFRYAIRHYWWTFANYEMNVIRDYEDSPYPGPFYQLAVRHGSSISISKPHWNHGLNDEHKVGLIFHEVIYSLLRPEFTGGNRRCQYQNIEDANCMFDQRSGRAREITAYLFSKDWDHRPFADLARVVRDLLPMSFGHGVREVTKTKLHLQPSISGVMFFDGAQEDDKTAYCKGRIASEPNDVWGDGRHHPINQTLDLFASYAVLNLKPATYNSRFGLKDFLDWGAEGSSSLNALTQNYRGKAKIEGRKTDDRWSHSRSIRYVKPRSGMRKCKRFLKDKLYGNAPFFKNFIMGQIFE